MLRPDPSSIQTDGDSTHVPQEMSLGGGVDIQQELNNLEELILSSPRMPFSGRTLVDEDRLLDQLDLIRLNLPSSFRDATLIVQQREAIISEAQRYAQELVAATEQEAAQRLDELGIIRQAERVSHQIKEQAQRECDQLRTKTLAEIEQLRLKAQREWERLSQQAMAEQQTIQAEADAYAGDVLNTLEQQLTAMLRIVHNGLSQLQPLDSSETPPTGNPSGRARTSPLPQAHRSS